MGYYGGGNGQGIPWITFLVLILLLSGSMGGGFGGGYGGYEAK